MMPTQLHLMMAVAALAFRDKEAQAPAAGRRSGTHTQEKLATT
jgi:hypothetical protein